LSLDDADTLTYDQNQFKQAQNDLLKSQTRKKQDKLLANVACDHGDDRVTVGQNLGPMWNYLRKYKNNHAKNLVPPLNLAPTHLLMPESGRSDLLPTTPLIGTATDSPWVTTSSTTNSPHMTRQRRNRHNSVQAQTYTATPNTHPLFMLPFTLLELSTQIKKLFPDKSPGHSGITNRMLQAAEAGDAEFQFLLLLLFNATRKYHVQPTDWQLLLMQHIYKGHDKDKADPASYRGIYLKDTLAKLFGGHLLLVA